MKKLLLVSMLFVLAQVTMAQAPRPFPVGLPTCLEDDFRELEKFYDAHQGSLWGVNWLVNPDMSKWKGIILTSDSCDVKEINLSKSTQLKGSIADSDINLPKLEVLDLSVCGLTGTVPNFAFLPKLKILNLRSNQFTVGLPNFNNLPDLEELYLFSCSQLTGSIPDFSFMPKLKIIDLQRNPKLTGNIPDFQNLPNLESLNLSRCGLTGVSNFSNLPNLKVIDISFNALLGNVPNFTGIPQIESLPLHHNQFTGFLPDFSNLPNLKNLDINNNELTGNIPNFSKILQLELLSLNNNKFTGVIPDFSNLPNLQYLNLGYNELSGNIPNFTNIPKLKQLILSNNKLTGTIPDFSNLPILNNFSLNINQLSGNIPDWSNVPLLTSIDCSSNQLSGNIPNFSKIANITSLEFSFNQLSGNIPSLTSCPKLKELLLWNNNLSGDLPSFSFIADKAKFLISISKNFFNYGNIEKNVDTIIQNKYWPEKFSGGRGGAFDQKTILPVINKGSVLEGDLGGSILNLLTYFWYKDNTLIANSIGNNLLTITKTGKYFYFVTHSKLTPNTGMELYSKELSVGAIVKGKVFIDSNTNCTFENTEKTRKDVILRFESTKDTVITLTDSLGNYEVALDTFAYKITVSAGNYWKTCTLPNLKFNSWSDSLNLNIPLQPSQLCPDMQVDLSTIRLRRCFDNSYNVKYSNNGTIDAPNAYVIIDFDKWLTVKSASISYTQLTGNQYRFNLGTVKSLETNAFAVVVNVNCDSTVLGQTHCSTAHIYPDMPCNTSNLWDQSSILVKGKCVNNKVEFEVKNTGTAPTSQARQSIVIEDQIMFLQSPITLNSGESKFFTFEPNGKTVRMSVEQANYHPSNNLFATAAVEHCGNATPSLGFVTQFGESDNEPWLDTDCRPNIGSYDPNEKLPSPLGYGAEHKIEPNTEIEYQINFQNYGSDTAFTVVLRDTLDKSLNLSTLQLGASSHLYSWTLEGRSTLIVTFDKINLTAKKQDEAKSQGFIRYRIAQNRDVKLGTTIKNRAGIYFDFNAPVMTNTTTHLVAKNFITVAVPDLSVSSLKVSVSPNPFENQTIFKLENSDNESFTLKIMDNVGRVLHQQTSDNGQVVFNTFLPQGVYFYRIENEKGSASGKLIRN